MQYLRALVVTVIAAGCGKEAPGEPAGTAADALSRACPGPVPRADKGKTCAQNRCESGFELGFQPKAPWPQGTYEFTFDVDGRQLACTGRLPLEMCAHGNVRCDGAGVTITESGCDLPVFSHVFWSVSFEGYPRHVSVSVQLDGAPVGSVKIAPVYERSLPNGPGCEPTCCSASGELTLDFPPG
jgi:hypothetical protein